MNAIMGTLIVASLPLVAAVLMLLVGFILSRRELRRREAGRKAALSMPWTCHRCGAQHRGKWDSAYRDRNGDWWPVCDSCRPEPWDGQVVRTVYASWQ